MVVTVVLLVEEVQLTSGSSIHSKETSLERFCQSQKLIPAHRASSSSEGHKNAFKQTQHVGHRMLIYGQYPKPFSKLLGQSVL